MPFSTRSKPHWVRRDRVELRGFGAFSVKTQRARLGRNPKTGVSLSFPKTDYPVFRTGKAASELHAAFHKL